MTIGGLVGYIQIFRFQAAQRANYSSRDFDAREVFQQIRAGTVPSDWSVFRASRKKVIGTGFLFCLIPFPTFLSLDIITAFGPDSIMPFYEKYSVLLGSILLTMLIPFLLWKEAKNLVLVVTPDGFIYGNCQKPQKVLRLKYRDITEIKVMGNAVSVLAKDDWGKRYLDCSMLGPSTREAASGLLTAFARYKADYPDGVITAAPLFVSRFAREKNEG